MRVPQFRPGAPQAERERAEAEFRSIWGRVGERAPEVHEDVTLEEVQLVAEWVFVNRELQRARDELDAATRDRRFPEGPAQQAGMPVEAFRMGAVRREAEAMREWEHWSGVAVEVAERGRVLGFDLAPTRAAAMRGPQVATRSHG